MTEPFNAIRQPLPLLVVSPIDSVAYAEASLVIHAPIGRIWALVTDVERWPLWNPTVSKVRSDNRVAPGSTFKWVSGGLTIRSTFHDVRPMTDLSWTGAAFGTRARHGWAFKPAEKGTMVTTRESFDGWLPRLMPGAMNKMLDRTLVALLKSLKFAAEGHSDALTVENICWRARIVMPKVLL